MSRTATQREAARLRKQRQRDRDREKNRAAAEAMAAKQEAIAENLAPSIMRHMIQSYDERVLLGARVVVVDGRPVRALLHFDNPIENVFRKSPLFTKRHREAAQRLQRDWAEVGAGVGAGAVDLMKSGGNGSNDGGDFARKSMLGQIEARMRLEGALTFVGAFAPGLARLLFDCVPVKNWAEEDGREIGEALAWLALGLTRLTLFYWPPKPEAKAGEVTIRTIGPERAEYTTEME